MRNYGGEEEVVHGSHREHPLKPLGQDGHVSHLCSICQAQRSPHDGGWYVCTVCVFYLCHKCVVVDEEPFDSPQIVVRNPQLLASDETVGVWTRPRSNSYMLSPLYDGMLIEVVAYAMSTVDKGCTYFRQRWGGWIKADSVVCVTPANFVFDRLAQMNLQIYNKQRMKTPTKEFIEQCMEESMEMINNSPPFGAIMACYTLLPMQYALREQERSKGAANVYDHELLHRAIRFEHFLLHYVLDELEYMMDGSPVPLVKNTALMLHVKLVGRCLAVLEVIPSVTQQVMPRELGRLVCRAMDVLVRLTLILRQGERMDSDTSGELWHFVAHVHATLEEMESTARVICHALIRHTEKLLLMPCFVFGVADLKPLRSAIILAQELQSLMEHLLCQLVVKAVQIEPSEQKLAGSLDMVEVIVHLLLTDQPKSILVACQALEAIVRGAPVVIAQVASVVLKKLLIAGKTVQDPHVVAAIVNAITALASSAPSEPHAQWLGSNGTAPMRNGCHPNKGLACASDVGWAVEACERRDAFSNEGPTATCTSHGSSLASNLQPITIVRQEGSQRLVPLCEHCGVNRHERGTVVSVLGGAKWANFCCGCTICRSKGPPDVVSRSLPALPLSSVAVQIKEMNAAAVLATRVRLLGPPVANAVGRLVLQLEGDENAIVTLMYYLLDTQLKENEDAVLAVVGHAYLPSVKEIAQKHRDSDISRWVLDV